jgi:hypothetical protein
VFLIIAVDESWTEGEDGKAQSEQADRNPTQEGESVNSTDKKDESSEDSKNITISDNTLVDEPGGDATSSSESFSDSNNPKSRSDVGNNETIIDCIKAKESLKKNPRKDDTQKGIMGHCEMTGTSSRCKSRASDLGEFREGDVSESEQVDDRRKSRRIRGSSSSRSRSPELHRTDINRSPSQQTLSSQQILQGLPYLHLLPPAMRNGETTRAWKILSKSCDDSHYSHNHHYL